MSVFDGFKPFEQSRKITSIIRMDCSSMLLSQYLAMRFTYRTQSEWLEEIAAERFLLDNQRINSDCTVFSNSSLTYEFAEKAEPECDLNYDLLGIDEHFICVSKSGNLPTHPAGRYYRNSLWYLLQKDFGPCAPINRLDRETSGVILFARTPAAASFFSQTAMQKKYRVIVHGSFPDELDADGFIMADSQSPIRKKRKFSYQPGSSAAYETCRTVFKKIAFKNGLSLIEAELKTGRTHQIRATCSSLGYPVAGDKIYGTDETVFLRFIDGNMTEQDRKNLIYERQALHAYSLEFKNFSDDSELSFTADFDLQADFIL